MIGRRRSYQARSDYGDLNPFRQHHLGVFGEGMILEGVGIGKPDRRLGDRFSFNNGTPANSTDIAPGLTNGTNAVGTASVHGDATDIRYIGITTGTRNALLAAIANDANWEEAAGATAAGYTDITAGAGFTQTGVPVELQTFTVE